MSRAEGLTKGLASGRDPSISLPPQQTRLAGIGPGSRRCLESEHVAPPTIPAPPQRAGPIPAEYYLQPLQSRKKSYWKEQADMKKQQLAEARKLREQSRQSTAAVAPSRGGTASSSGGQWMGGERPAGTPQSRQTRSMVLNLENLEDSTEEVLEMELARPDTGTGSRT